MMVRCKRHSRVAKSRKRCKCLLQANSDFDNRRTVTRNRRKEIVEHVRYGQPRREYPVELRVFRRRRPGQVRQYANASANHINGGALIVDSRRQCTRGDLGHHYDAVAGVSVEGPLRADHKRIAQRIVAVFIDPHRPGDWLRGLHKDARKYTDVDRTTLRLGQLAQRRHVDMLDEADLVREQRACARQGFGIDV